MNSTTTVTTVSTVTTVVDCIKGTLVLLCFIFGTVGEHNQSQASLHNQSQASLHSRAHCFLRFRSWKSLCTDNNGKSRKNCRNSSRLNRLGNRIPTKFWHTELRQISNCRNSMLVFKTLNSHMSRPIPQLRQSRPWVSLKAWYTVQASAASYGRFWVIVLT